MKKTAALLVTLLVALGATAQQTFPTTTALPVDLDLGTNYSACATPGTKAFSFAVTGVGTLSATNALSAVDLQFDGACGSNLRDLAAYIAHDPDGAGGIAPTCLQVYTGALMGTTASGQTYLRMVSNTACLNPPNTSNLPSSAVSLPTVSGHYGAFGMAGDLTATFAGHNADAGTWTLYWFESGSAPCLAAASLVFGDPAVDSYTSPAGDLCGSPIVWDGSPLCATTSGQTGNLNSPGSNTGQGDLSLSTFANGTCDWNANNNNDTWVQFVATGTQVCISISGLQNNLQSIVVTHPSGNGSACPANGEGWNLVSCPRSGGNAVYGTTSGTQQNQQHCFTAVVGNTYYLVVDGNGGAESPFYVMGTSGVNPVLAVEWLDFQGDVRAGVHLLSWATTTESDHHHFLVERSGDGTHFTAIGTVAGAGNSQRPTEYAFADQSPQPGYNYYRLQAYDREGNARPSEVIVLRGGAVGPVLATYPDPFTTDLRIVSDASAHMSFALYNLAGQLLRKVEGQGPAWHIDTQDLPPGLYHVVRLDGHWGRRVVKQSP